MELMQRVQRLFLFKQSARVEFDARCLIQKLAREEAAVRAVRVARLRGNFYDIDRLERVARNARLLRDHAQTMLRRELGLTDAPTAIEVADWGIAPGRSDRPEGGLRGTDILTDTANL